MKGQKDGTYNIMRKFKILEIAGVHNGAMGEGSNMAIMKRLEKKAAMTDPMDGHSHVLTGFDEHVSGHTDGFEDGAGNYHAHPWLIGLNGELIVGAANGHTHRVGFFSKQVAVDVLDETHTTLEQLSASSEESEPADGNTQDPTMNESEFQAKIDELTKSLAEVTADRAVILAYSKMTDAEKAHHATLASNDEMNAFIASSDKSGLIAKAAEIAKALDPVVATTEDGVEILKSQDPTGLLTAAIEKAKDDKKKKKKDDEDKDKLSFLSKEADLAKRAAELTNLPGDEATRMEILKSLDSIEDEDVRKSALEALVARNTELADAFMEKGSVGNPKDQSADEKLDTMAKSLMEKDNTTYEVAYTKAVLTDEGQEIYNKRLEG